MCKALILLFVMTTFFVGHPFPEVSLSAPGGATAPVALAQGPGQIPVSLSAPILLASGTLEPAGPPLGPPDRRPGGSGCLVDVTLPYILDGTLAGSAVISLRIDVAGPCGVPPGTYDERWIGEGSFQGTVDGSPVSACFAEVGRVKAGGDVRGWIWFTRGLRGLLRIDGNMANGYLEYRGLVW